MRGPSRTAAASLRAALTALAIATSAIAAGQPASALGTPALTWSAPRPFDAPQRLAAIACTSETLCAAVDARGYAFATSSPAGAEPHWNASAIDEGNALEAISCAPSGPCVAVDARGVAFVSEAGLGPWTGRSIDAGSALSSVSCPSSSLCVAVDTAGRVLTSTAPLEGPWSSATVDSGQELTGVSCASSTLCVAIDANGNAIASTNPTGGAGAWHTQQIDFARLDAVSCAGTACVAVDHDGAALASSDAAAQLATWSETPVDDEALGAVSCDLSGLCVAVDGDGRALASDDPLASTPDWTASAIDAHPLSGVSCLPGGLCLAVDAGGDASAGRVAAPQTVTLAPAAATTTATTALLSGSVDPHDATLESCEFEWGTALPYSEAVACASTPSPNGGSQDVSAALSGLEPNTTYRYRLLASSASGTSAGADATFTTAPSATTALVYPHPSITGTPAPGQTLTCHPGTAAGSVARLTYAWLRDQIPIAGASGAGYGVKGQDSSHHLQCEVTATDGGGSASARSAFVTVPAGAVPVSSGETAIGAARASGARVSVPVLCSPLASGGCQIRAQLMATETLQGAHVVAIGASASAPRAPGRGAALRRRTITLAATHAHLGTGASATLTLTLDRASKRALGALGGISADLYVRGTVIGLIEAQLSHQSVTLRAPATRRGARRARTAALASTPAPRAGTGAARAAASQPLAATPYMGWDTYFALGGRYSEATVLQEASELIHLGLRRRGYRYVWLDVGWWHGTRAADGQIAVDSAQWPHGLAWLTSTLHAAGFRVGLYTDAGPNGCGGAGQGSYGHYQQDVDTFAAWGFDAVKVDFCGGAEYGLEPAGAYSQFHDAIEADPRHRPMLLSICDFLLPEQFGEGRPGLDASAFSSYSFGPTVGNSWRTDTDVGRPGAVPFSDVLRNLDADAAEPQAAGPGHWNDPDYLAPDQGMSAAQFRTQLSMWAMLAAPLMVSDDLRRIGAASLAALRNSEVIAVDQDPQGAQATLLSARGTGEVWVKPLAGGGRAVALMNRGSGTQRIETRATALGLPAAPAYAVRNLWTHRAAPSPGPIAYEVPADSTVLLRVTVD